LCHDGTLPPVRPGECCGDLGGCPDPHVVYVPSTESVETYSIDAVLGPDTTEEDVEDILSHTIESMGLDPEDGQVSVAYTVESTGGVVVNETITNLEEVEDCLIEYLLNDFPCIHPSAMNFTLSVVEDGSVVYSLKLVYSGIGQLMDLENIMENSNCPGAVVTVIDTSEIRVRANIFIAQNEAFADCSCEARQMDGILSEGEECDDGNEDSYDHCRATCDCSHQ